MVANEAGSGGRESAGGRFESLNGIVRKGLNEQLTLEQKREEPLCIPWVSEESIPEGKEEQGPGVMGALRVQRPAESQSHGGSMMTGGGSDQCPGPRCLEPSLCIR